MAEEGLGIKFEIENPVTLTDKQKLFAKYYVECGRLKKAAEKAGYKGKHICKTAAVLIRKPGVVAEIAKIRNEAASRADLSIKKVIEMHMNVYEKAMERQDFQAAERAAEAMGRTIGAYQDRRTQDLHILDGTSGSQAKDMDTKLEKVAGMLGLKVSTGKANKLDS